MIYCQMENLKKNASEDDKKREEDRKQSEVYESHSKFMKCKVSTSGYFGVWIFISLLLLIVPWDVYLKFSLLWKTKFSFSFHVVIFGLKSTLLSAQLIQDEQSFQVIFCLFIFKSTWQSACQVTFVG